MEDKNVKQTEVKTKVQTETKDDLKIDSYTEPTYTIIEMLELASKGNKFSRLGWSKHISNAYVTINRGETKPVLYIGKFFSAYQPSIEDVMNKDWIEVL